MQGLKQDIFNLAMGVGGHCTLTGLDTLFTLLIFPITFQNIAKDCRRKCVFCKNSAIARSRIDASPNMRPKIGEKPGSKGKKND